MMELLNEFLSGSVAWGVLLTLAAFALGALVNRVTGKAFFNPLLLGAIFVIVFLSVCGIPYADYKVSAAPVNYLLLPATVALAIPLYEKLDLLKANAAAIIAGISVGTLVSLGSALALALALHLTQEQYATLLPKSVTTAISMDVAAEQLEVDYYNICDQFNMQLSESSKATLHTASGEFIQIRTKDSKPYHPIFSNIYDREISDKNRAFYFKKDFMKYIVSLEY